MYPVVSTSWLNENLQEPELILLDASLPGTAEGETTKTDRVVIPGARFFDLKKRFSDPDAPFPNTMPSPEQFESTCRVLGINKNSKIIIYDNMGVYASPRVWWMFKAMGHEEVYVLDGGLPEWINDQYQVDVNYNENYASGNFKASYQDQLVKTYQEVLKNAQAQSFQMVDARSQGRFRGHEPEPRKQLKSGHIPGSVNIPYQQVLNQNKFKDTKSLIELFQEKLGKEEQLVYSCGSGLTACIIMLAGQLAGKKSMVLYDGSWTEWATLQGQLAPMEVFFYGLFMDESILAKNGVGAINPRKAYLQNYELRIGNRASLIPAPGEISYGILMTCDQNALQRLYSESSVADYLPETVTVGTDNLGPIEATCYNLPTEKISGTNSSYVESLYQLAKRLGFPQAYLQKIMDMSSV